jgi:hypothetical protein
MTDAHTSEDFQMTRTTVVRGLGLVGIVGGALWIAFGILAALRAPGGPGGARDVDDLTPLIALGLLLFVASLFGLYLRQGQHWPTWANVALIASALGGAETGLALFLGWPWSVVLFGYFALACGLLVTGLLLIQAGPASRLHTLLLPMVGLSLLLFNTEDWRALFGAAAGVFIITLASLLLAASSSSQSQGEPSVAA